MLISFLIMFVSLIARKGIFQAVLKKAEKSNQK